MKKVLYIRINLHLSTCNICIQQGTCFHFNVKKLENLFVLDVIKSETISSYPTPIREPRNLRRQYRQSSSILGSLDLELGR